MAKIFYKDIDDFLRKDDRYKLLDEAVHIYNVDFDLIVPDKKHNWLTEGMEDDWETMIQIGSKEAKQGSVSGGQGSANANAIFGLYSLGISTNRDAWVYNHCKEALSDNIKKTIEFFNEHIFKLQRANPKPDIDDFVVNDDEKISWSRDLKLKLKRSLTNDFDLNNVRRSLYRPFNYQNLYYNKIWVDITAQYSKIFPTSETEKENLVICCNGVSSEKPFSSIISNLPVNLAFLGGGTGFQCFPFYTYKEDGTERRENISDWGLKQYQEQYKDDRISKWDIFYYIYAVLHKPEYREKYAANLKRELPRIPFYEDFWKHSEAGRRLADLHVNYEEQPEYYLQKIETPDKQLDWKVEKMKLSKDKTTLIYNDFLTLTGIPLECYDYKLGNRSALEWVIDQYQVKTDKRSGITNDPNRPDQPDYIVRLIGKIITVSLETMKVVREL